MQDSNLTLQPIQAEFDQLKPKLDLPAKRHQLVMLQAEAAAPDLWQDEIRAKLVNRQISHLQSDLDTVQGLQQRLASLSELANSFADLDTASQADFQTELAATKKQLNQLKISTVLSGPYDSHPAIITIFSGQGGVEAMDWAQMLLRMYLRYFEVKTWPFEHVQETPGEEAGIKSATLLVSAPYAYGYLKSESGTHRLVRQSPFNADNLRQTSFAGVEVLPHFEDREGQIEINPGELEWQFFRSGGKGGQNVNKVSTAVRLKHLPSGIVVTSQAQRHQEQNRKIALSILEAKLWQQQEQANQQHSSTIKGEHKQAAWGNQIRSYVLHPYQMVKDHRSQYETHDAQAVLDGDLDSFVEAYLFAV